MVPSEEAPDQSTNTHTPRRFKDDQSSFVANSTSSWFGYPYMMQLENFKYSEIDTIFVDFAHIQVTEENLASAIKEQYYR